MLVVPHGHELAQRPRAKLTEVLPFVHIGLQDDNSLHAKVESKAANAGETVRTCMVVLSFDCVRRMVEAGLGVAVLPRGAVIPYVDSLDIAAVELDEPWANRTLLIGYRDIGSLPIVCRRLIDQLVPQEG